LFALVHVRKNLTKTTVSWTTFSFYHAMLRTSVCLCLSVCPSLCDARVPWSHGLEYFGNNFTAD